MRLFKMIFFGEIKLRRMAENERFFPRSRKARIITI